MTGSEAISRALAEWENTRKGSLGQAYEIKHLDDPIQSYVVALLGALSAVTDSGTHGGEVSAHEICARRIEVLNVPAARYFRMFFSQNISRERSS